MLFLIFLIPRRCIHFICATFRDRWLEQISDLHREYLWKMVRKNTSNGCPGRAGLKPMTT